VPTGGAKDMDAAKLQKHMSLKRQFRFTQFVTVTEMTQINRIGKIASELETKF